MKARFALGVGLCLASCGSDNGAGSSASAASASLSAGSAIATVVPTAALALTATTTAATPNAALSPAIDPSVLNVLFIGGSITQGAYASTPDKSYAGLVSAWLRTRYPQFDVRNIGVGGTGSEFGVYRVDHDLGGFTPDLAFIEFTVNDAGTSEPLITAHIDGIIDKLRRRNPRVKIIYLATTDASEEALRRMGQRAAFAQVSVDVAAYENIQFIDIGAAIWAQVIAGGAVSSYLADAVHPTDLGHQIYYQEIRRVLEPMLPLPIPDAIAGGKLVAQSHLDTARLESTAGATGCRIGTLPLAYMAAALQCGKGDNFSYHFTGTTIGMVAAIVRNGGRLACTVDGQTPQTIDFFDVTALSYDRIQAPIAYRNLTPGDHLLACQVTGDVISVAGGASTGNAISIGYFMVSDERPVTL